MTTRERRTFDEITQRLAKQEKIIRSCHDEIERANERHRSHQKLTQDFQLALTEIASLRDLDKTRRKEIQLLRDTLFVTAKMLAEANRK